MVFEKIYALISSNACKSKLEFGFPKLWSIFGHGATFENQNLKNGVELCLLTNFTCLANLKLHCQVFKTNKIVIFNVNFTAHGEACIYTVLFAMCLSAFHFRVFDSA